MNGKPIYVITAFGVGIDTEVHLCRTHEEAEGTAKELLSDWQMTDPEEMCYDCWKGYSPKAQCDIEVEIHEKVVPAEGGGSSIPEEKEGRDFTVEPFSTAIIDCVVNGDLDSDEDGDGDGNGKYNHMMSISSLELQCAGVIKKHLPDGKWRVCMKSLEEFLGNKLSKYSHNGFTFVGMTTK